MEKILCRGGKLVKWNPVFSDDIWSADDWERAATLEARWKSQNISESERQRLIPCAIYVRKWPGTIYPDDIMSRLQELFVESK